jgi:glycosyltransferase involved in cell wall biosynthesis
MKTKILFYIELPPPVHGMTYINKIIYDGLKSDEKYHFHNVDFSSEVSDIGKRGLSKVWQNIKLAFGAWKSFFKIMPTQVYSIVSASMFGIVRDFLILIPSVVFSKKRILHLHGFTYYDIYQNSKLYRVLFDILVSNSKLIVLCEAQKEKTKVIMKKDSIVLYNALQNDVIVDMKTIDKSNIKLLYISNISRLKGTLDLLESIKNIENVSLTVAGSFWTDEDEFRKLCEEMKDKVNFVGFADETKKQELLNTHDIFCIPSRLSEGSPVSIIEAMAYGLPIIGTEKGCIKEMIGECGYVVNGVLDEKEMNKALESITQDYEVYSQKALENYRSLYSKDVFIKRLEEIINA